MSEAVGFEPIGLEKVDIEAVMRKAVGQALLMHKRIGNPIAVWDNGQVVLVPPEEIPVDDQGNIISAPSDV